MIVKFTWGYVSSWWFLDGNLWNTPKWSHCYITFKMIPKIFYRVYKYDGMPVRYFQLLFIGIGWGEDYTHNEYRDVRDETDDT